MRYRGWIPVLLALLLPALVVTSATAAEKPWRTLTTPHYRVMLRDPGEEDARILATGLRVFPGGDWIRVGAAAVDFRLGRRAPAREAVNQALRPDSTLDDRQRSFAVRLRRSLQMDAMIQEIRTAMERGDPAAARAAFERDRGDIAGEAEADAMLQRIDADLQRASTRD